ncbi:MAG TPA: OsmC family protein [Marmoricola sp.]|nr:OsmC family protein [Marmoricola sp.]
MTVVPPEQGRETHRAVELTRIGTHRYKATNVRGGVLPIGEGEDPDFTPVELLLAAIAGCSAIDVDYITGKRSAPASFDVHVEGEKVRDEQGNHLSDLRVVFDVTFPEGEAGDAAREVLQSAIERSRDRLCTVSRTVALATPVEMERAASEPVS